MRTKFRKPCNEDHEDEDDSFFDCWDGKQEQSDALQQMNPWARNTPKSEPDVKGCLSVNFLHVQCALSWECTNVSQRTRHSMTSPVKEKTDRATTPMMKSGELEEVDLNAVTIGNMSIDSRPTCRNRC